MGNLQDERLALSSHLKTNFTTIPIKWENRPFDQDIKEFVEIFIRPGKATPTSISNTQISYERIGLLILSVFTPKGTGTDRNKEIADELEELFLKETIGQSTFNESEYIPVGEIEERYRGNLLLYYRWKKCV